MNNDLYRINVLFNTSCQYGADFENLNHYFFECSRYLNSKRPFH